MKNMFKIFVFGLTVFLAVQFNAYGQVPPTSLRLTNVTQVNPNQVTFDVYLKNRDTATIEFSTWQYLFNFAKGAIGGTTLASINSSELSAQFLPRNPVVNTAYTPARVTYSTNTLPTRGNGYFLKAGDSVHVMKGQLDCTAGISAQTMNLKFMTTGYTTITAFIGTTGTNISSGITFYVDTVTAVTKVEDAKRPTPVNYSLNQNYPNPFNPDTKIEYQIPNDGNVTLELYNQVGQKIATLVNQYQTSGYYSYRLNYGTVGRGLASGVYIYKLVATGSNNQKYVSIKKMMLLK